MVVHVDERDLHPENDKSPVMNLGYWEMMNNHQLTIGVGAKMNLRSCCIKTYMTVDQEVLAKFRTTELKSLKTLFDALKENITDVTIYFRQEGIFISSFDPTHTLYTEVNLGADNFDFYHCAELQDDEGNEKPISVTVSIQNIFKMALKTINNDDDVMEWEYRGGKVLLITIWSTVNDECRWYEVNLQEDDSSPEAANIDRDNYPYILTMPCTHFQRICRDLKGMNVQVVTIQHDGTNLSFISSADAGKGGVIRKGVSGKLDNDNEKDIVFCKVPEITSCYEDDFKFDSLNNLSKCANIGSKGGKIVQLYLTPGKPMIVIFKVGKLGEVMFVLASRDNTDENQ